MKYRNHIWTSVQGLFLLAATGACLTPAVCGAETTAADSAAPALNQDAAQAILQELKEIRRVLEKIERQGVAQTAQRPDTRQTASVPIGKDVGASLLANTMFQNYRFAGKPAPTRGISIFRCTRIPKD